LIIHTSKALRGYVAAILSRITAAVSTQAYLQPASRAHRRSSYLWVMLAGVLWAGYVQTATAQAQGRYPTKVVTIICPFTAGGFTDIVTRLAAKGLSDKWGVAVVVDNRAGAGGNVGGAVAAKAPNDGYTLLAANAATNGVNPAIYKKMSFDSLRDFDAVALIVKTPNIMVVNNAIPAKTVKELVALAKAKPGSLNFGSPGSGTTGHLTGVLFGLVAGVELVHVPYKGSPQVMADIQGGSVQVSFDNIISWSPLVMGGKVRPLAVTSSERSPLLPDVPTMAEAGFPAVESTSWFGVAAPHGTPKEIIDKINADVVAVITTPEFRAKMNGGEVVGGTPEQFQQFMAEEIKKWGKVAQSIGLSVD